MTKHCECSRPIRVQTRRGWRVPDRWHDLCSRCWQSEMDALMARQLKEAAEQETAAGAGTSHR